MSDAASRKSKIKLRLKDKQLNDIYLNVYPDDTFETLQLRAGKETGLSLDLTQYSHSGLEVNPKRNVLEYIKDSCQGGSRMPASGAVKKQDLFSGLSPTQMSSTQPGSDEDFKKEEETVIELCAEVNNPKRKYELPSTYAAENGLPETDKGLYLEIDRSEAMEVSNNGSDVVMEVVEDYGEILQEDSNLCMIEVKSEDLTEDYSARALEDGEYRADVQDDDFEVHEEGEVEIVVGMPSDLDQRVEVPASSEDTKFEVESASQDGSDKRKIKVQAVGDAFEQTYEQQAVTVKEQNVDDSSNDSDSFGDVPDDVDLRQLCRLCGQEKNDMVFIFSEEGMNMCLKEKINSWLPLNVKKTDLYPKQVCDDCVDKVTICQDFGMQCLRAQKFLQRLVNENKFRCVDENAVADLVKTRSGGNVKFDAAREDSAVVNDLKSAADACGNKVCCPLCITGTITTKCSEDDNSEVSNSEEETESFKADPLVVQDDPPSPLFEEQSKKRSVSPVFADSLMDDSTMDYDQSALLVETVYDEPASVDPMGWHTDIPTPLTMFPRKRGRPRGRPRGSRSRALYSGVGMGRGSGRARGRGRGRGRGRAKFNQQVMGVMGETSVSCCLCKTVLEGSSDAFLHTLLSHSTEPHSYFCSLCGESSTDRSSVINHFCEVHGCKVTAYERYGDEITLLFYCYECSTAFRSERTLNNHNCEQIFESKCLKCSICGTSFVTKARLYFHQQFHWDKNRAMCCKSCNLDFTDEDTMYDHFKFSHRGEKYVCSVCGTHFNSKSAFHCHKRTHTNKRRFKCDVCSKLFYDKQTLKEHVVCHMETRPYQCHICGKDLSRYSRLKRHLKAHESYNAPPQEVFKCVVCEEVFSNEEKAYEHTQADNPDCKLDAGAQYEFVMQSVDKVYRCEFCERCYSIPSVLNKHRKLHTGDLPYRCHVCDSAFVSYARCATHKVTHGVFLETDVKEFNVPKYFLCEHCGRYYLHWTYLSVHRRVRHGPIKYMFKCKFCGEEFTNSWSLSHHRKQHYVPYEGRKNKQGDEALDGEQDFPTGRKPYECDICGKRYLYEQSLFLHKKNVHSEEESGSYQCDKCGKVFSRKMYLDSHQKTHEGEKDFVCKMCNSSFVHGSSLTTHIRRVHIGHKPYCCDHCGKKFVQKSDLTDHVRKHTGDKPFNCEYCEKTFRTRGIWLEHSRIHRDERPFPCDICGAAFRRSFALKNHRTIHTGVRAFVCEGCGRSFRLKQELTKHLKFHHPDRNEEMKLETDTS